MAVILTDASFFGIGRFVGGAKSLIGFSGKVDFATSKRFGLFLLVVAFSIKLYIALNIGFFNIIPADTIGYYGLHSIVNTLIPIGAGAFFGLNFIPVSILFMLTALLSYSKAQALIFFAAYAVYCSYGYGYKATMQKMFSVKILVVIVLMIAVIGFKTATRGGNEEGNAISNDLLMENAVAAVDARLLGGIHRAYLTVMDEIVSGRMDTMGGRYHLQTLYLWIPSAIWPEKPSVASQELYYYLHVIGEEYGTSFAINPIGFLVVDFGLIGAFIGIIFLGILLRLGEFGLISVISTNAKDIDGQTFRAGLVTSWVMSVQFLSEGGIPPMILGLLVSLVSCVAGYVLYILLFSIIRRKSARREYL